MRTLLLKAALLSIVLFCQHTVVSAQSFRGGVVAGMNVGSVTDCGSRLGYRIGVKGEYAISKGWYMDAALLLSSKGYKEDVFFGTPDNIVKEKCSATYIELPIHAGYKFNVADNVKLLVNAGPYFAYGLFGNAKLNGKKVSGNVFSDYYNRFDCGVGANAGVEMFGHLQVYAGYDWGLKNISKSSRPDCKNRTFNISCSYIF